MKPNFPNRRFLSWFGLTLLIVLLGFIPVRINIAFRQAPIPPGSALYLGVILKWEYVILELITIN